MATTQTVPEVSLEVNDPGVIQDPGPKFEEIRAAGPVVLEPDLGRYMTTSYEHVRTTAGNDRLVAPDAQVMKDLFGASIFEGEDNPRHNDIRNIFGAFFTREYLDGTVRPMAEELVAEHLEPIVERLRAGEVVDAVPEFSLQVSAKLIAGMLGVPREDVPVFVGWSEDIGKVIAAITEPDPEVRAEMHRAGNAATEALCEYTGEQLAERRRTGRDDDIIGALALSEYAREHMTEQEQRSNIALLVFAGHDNVQKAVSWLMVVFAQHPDQRDAVRDDPSLMPQAIEELFRYSSSVTQNPKIARRDIVLDGMTIPAGAPLLPLIAAANKDPQRWERPYAFDIFREPRQHIQFSFGPHSCLGSNLARLELTTTFRRMLELIPEWGLADEEIRYGPRFGQRGPMTVPLAI